jgi:hypothetical protein
MRGDNTKNKVVTSGTLKAEPPLDNILDYSKKWFFDDARLLKIAEIDKIQTI